MTSKDFSLIAELFDRPIAIVLSRKIGGRQYYIPKKPNANLIECLGLDNAMLLCSSLGTTMIRLPSRVGIEKMIRNEKIRLMIQAGESTLTICTTVGVSDDWVRRVRRKHA